VEKTRGRLSGREDASRLPEAALSEQDRRHAALRIAFARAITYIPGTVGEFRRDASRHDDEAHQSRRPLA